MLRLYGKYTLMYLFGALALFAAMGAAAVGIPGISDSTGGVIMLVCFFLLLFWAIFCARRAVVGYGRIVHILDDQCDSETFINAQRKIYRKACRIKHIRSATGMNAVVVRINQAVALAFDGRHTEAMNEIHAILALPANRSKDYIHAQCHINLAIFLARRNEEGDIAAAREHLRKANECFKATGQSSSALSGEIIRAGYTVDAAEGTNLEAALDYFGKNLDNAPVLRAEAAYRYQMAAIYRQMVDTEKERAQLELVSNSVPKAHIGKLAASRLAELSSQ